MGIFRASSDCDLALALRCVAVGSSMISIACVYVPLGANKQIDLSAVRGKGRHMSLGGDRAGSIQCEGEV